MPRKPQSRGHCQYCGEEITKRSITKHLTACAQRAQVVQAAQAGQQPIETLWHLRVEDSAAKEFWLDLEMSGSATLEKLDFYLRAIWLECCGHMSQFTVNGWGSLEIGKARKADAIFTQEDALLHLYDFGTTSETAIRVVGSREGKATTKHPIALMARNNPPEALCQVCSQPATHLCLECMYEATEAGSWFLCAKHVEDHPHDEYGEPMLLVNSPRVGMCGYAGPATPPY